MYTYLKELFIFYMNLFSVNSLTTLFGQRFFFSTILRYNNFVIGLEISIFSTFTNHEILFKRNDISRIVIYIIHAYLHSKTSPMHRLILELYLFQTRLVLFFNAFNFCHLTLKLSIKLQQKTPRNYANLVYTMYFCCLLWFTGYRDKN